jgi:hypothetical protein
MKILLVLLVVVTTATAGETNTPPQLAVNLTDGSRIVGTAELPSLVVRSETLGRIEIPLAKVRGVKFDANHEAATVTLSNGDSLKGGLGALKLEMQTVFGSVTVPVEHITAINRRGGTQPTEEFNPAKPYGLHFDGGRAFVEVPHSAAFDLTEAMTVECWAKLDDCCDRQLANHYDPKSKTGWTFYIGGGWNQGVATFDSEMLVAPTGVHTGPDWHHFAVTWDGTNRRIFVDGRLATSDTPPRVTATAASLNIGGGPGDWRTLAGSMAELRISSIDRYRGKDFTPARQFAVDADTVSYWKMNEGSGSVVHDQSNNGHDGTLAGTPPPKWVNQAP